MRLAHKNGQRLSMILYVSFFFFYERYNQLISIEWCTEWLIDKGREGGYKSE